jgi:hypothetical protein
MRSLPSGRQTGNYPETSLEEINGDLLEADFGLGITSGLPVTRPQSAPSATYSHLLVRLPIVINYG